MVKQPHCCCCVPLFDANVLLCWRNGHIGYVAAKRRLAQDSVKLVTDFALANTCSISKSAQVKNCRLGLVVAVSQECKFSRLSVLFLRVNFNF